VEEAHQLQKAVAAAAADPHRMVPGEGEEDLHLMEVVEVVERLQRGVEEEGHLKWAVEEAVYLKLAVIVQEAVEEEGLLTLAVVKLLRQEAVVEVVPQPMGEEVRAARQQDVAEVK
jgi:hypothetical protein